MSNLKIRPSFSRIYSGAPYEQVAMDLKPLVDFAEHGISLGELDKLIERKLLPHLMRYDNPGFQSLFNTFLEKGAQHEARIALEWNQGVTNWQVSPGGAVLEELVVNALCKLFQLGPGSDGTFMYCGTYANQQAIYMALHKWAEHYGFNLAQHGLLGFDDPSRLTLLASTDAHFSIKHTVRMLGLGERSIIPVDVDENRKMDPDALAEILKEHGRSKDVFCVVATAGTTSTGSVDPIESTAKLCNQHGIWLHVDGAYGLAYKLVPQWEHLFSGVELADSVSWDPHKQLGVPIPSSVLFARRKGDFGRMAFHGSYFNREDAYQPNPGLKSAPTTRPLTALSLATSILHQGLASLIQRLRSPLVAIKKLAEFLEAESDMELCHQPDTGIACFRVVPESCSPKQLDELQKNIYNAIMEDRKRSVSISQLGNKTVLRLVAISQSVTFDALKETITMLREMSKTLV